tara:strand:+ start:12507 stop:13088 length:582 start_codon:yes stop_codon:yes gene_type:complete
MSEDTNTQIVEPQPKPYVERPLIEKPISTEVAPQSQEADIETPDIGQLVQESKKYRKRAQESEAKYETLNKKLEVDRQKQMEEQNQWQQLAEERAVKLAEMEPIVESFKKDESDQREQILSDFTDADREEFGGLSLPQLRSLHSKLINNNTVTPTSGAPARSLNPDNKHWTDMGKKERQENWGNIISGYSVRK